jgi:hypothetical protein
VGDAEARLRWVERLNPDRVNRMRELRRRFAEFARPHVAAIWEAKASSVKDRSRASSVRELARRYLALVDGFVNDNASEFEALALPPAAAKALVVAAVEQWLQSTQTPSAFKIPEQILERFPPAGRLFIQPETA